MSEKETERVYESIGDFHFLERYPDLRKEEVLVIKLLQGYIDAVNKDIEKYASEYNSRLLRYLNQKIISYIDSEKKRIEKSLEDNDKDYKEILAKHGDKKDSV